MCLAVVAFLLCSAMAVSTSLMGLYFLHTFHLMRLQTWQIASWCFKENPPETPNCDRQKIGAFQIGVEI